MSARAYLVAAATLAMIAIVVGPLAIILDLEWLVRLACGCIPAAALCQVAAARTARQ